MFISAKNIFNIIGRQFLRTNLRTINSNFKLRKMPFHFVYVYVSRGDVIFKFIIKI